MEKLSRIRLTSRQARINYQENVYKDIYYDKTDDMPYDMLKHVIEAVTPFEVSLCTKKVYNKDCLIILYSLEGLINYVRYVKSLESTVLAPKIVTDTVGFQIILPDIHVKAFWDSMGFSFFKLECTKSHLCINYDTVLSKLNNAGNTVDIEFRIGKNNIIYTYSKELSNVYDKDSQIFVEWESKRVVYKEENHKFTY